MSSSSDLVFFHNPQSRAAMIRALLEELGVDYTLRVLDFRKDEQRAPEYTAVNPMGKVPAIRHRGTVVTENVAIHIYLADAFPQANLAPALDDPRRGTYIRWLVFYAACFEPAVGDRAMQRDPAPRSRSPYADFDTTVSAITSALEPGPWLLGERFSAADVLWGNALRWVTGFGMVEATPAIADYVARVMARPAQQRARTADEALAAAMGLTG
ncbi:MAG TPA: glutathione S-transferase family protein [Rhodanobacteraceae bacterium]|jgi:glutathione S-transferase|nr:glutathione S-transferase family protein [Rhodanobacteraceae bacterium]